MTNRNARNATNSPPNIAASAATLVGMIARPGAAAKPETGHHGMRPVAWSKSRASCSRIVNTAMLAHRRKCRPIDQRITMPVATPVTTANNTE